MQQACFSHLISLLSPETVKMICHEFPKIDTQINLLSNAIVFLGGTSGRPKNMILVLLFDSEVLILALLYKLHVG